MDTHATARRAPANPDAILAALHLAPVVAVIAAMDRPRYRSAASYSKCGPDGTRLSRDTIETMADEAGDRERNEQ